MRHYGLFLAAYLSMVSAVSGQMIGVTPSMSTSSSMGFERMGVGFGFRLPAAVGPGSRIVGLGPGGQLFPNVSFGQNSFGSAIPGFGGYDPNASGRIGFGRIGDGGGGFSLLLEMGKGNSRTLSSVAPSIIVPNGQGGAMFDGEIRPFVTGTIPVVGSALGGSLSPWERQQFAILGTDPALTGPPAGNPSAEAVIRMAKEEAAQVGADQMNRVSTATRGARSVASIRGDRDAEKERNRTEIAALLAEADQCEAADDPVGARYFVRRALALETEPHRIRDLKTRLANLR